MSEAMLGVGSLPLARYCWEPEMARFEVLLPVSAKLFPPPPTLPSCPKSMLCWVLIVSLASFCLFSISLADTEDDLGMSEVEAGGLGDSEEIEGRGVELEDSDLRTCTEDGVEFEAVEVPLSRLNT